MICFVCLALCQRRPASYTHRRFGFGLKCVACTSSCLHSGSRLRRLVTCSTAATAVSSSACQTCLLSLDAVARSSESTPKRYWSSGRRSSWFMLSRLSMIRCMFFHIQILFQLLDAVWSVVSHFSKSIGCVWFKSDFWWSLSPMFWLSFYTSYSSPFCINGFGFWRRVLKFFLQQCFAIPVGHVPVQCFQSVPLRSSVFGRLYISTMVFAFRALK